MAFNDFGDEFIVTDQTGEEPVTGIVSAISQDTKGGIVTCLDETRHGLEDGDYVTFTEVEGMSELNGIEPQPINVLG